jgi:uncharacterized membrane protein YgdD (TMEM256/DUF423 family)
LFTVSRISEKQPESNEAIAREVINFFILYLFHKVTIINMNNQSTHLHLRVGAALCGLYVVLGAFGAHGLEHKLAANQLTTYHTALRYLIIHALALIITNFTYAHWGTVKRYSNLFFYLGMLLFSGSLLVHATRDLWGLDVNLFALTAPIGGLCYIIGWVFYLLKIGKQ